jgi:3-dehydroquinate synthase
MAANYKLTHGEAISIGMIAATKLAIHLKVCKEEILNRVRNLLLKAGLPTDLKNLNINANDVMDLMSHDKKTKKGKLRFVLPTGIGKWTPREIEDESQVKDIVKSLL